MNCASCTGIRGLSHGEIRSAAMYWTIDGLRTIEPTSKRLMWRAFWTGENSMRLSMRNCGGRKCTGNRLFSAAGYWKKALRFDRYSRETPHGCGARDKLSDIYKGLR